MNVNRFKWSKLLTVVVSVLTLTVFGQFKASATHFAAGEIYLTYIGEGADGCSNTSEFKYLITLDIYRACERGSSPAPTFATVNYGSVNGAFTGSVNFANLQRDTLHELCEAYADSNSCKVIPAQAGRPQFPAYVRHRFTDTLVLPSAQTDWLFSYNSCCRNGGIANGSANGNFYIETMLNNLTKYNNSTPRFPEYARPLPYLCAMQPSSYANLPFDLNKDSLYSTVQAPLSAANTPIPYSPTPPYSLGNPIGSITPFQFNPTTATAYFTPANQGLYVMAFKVEEFDRATGVSLGYIIRDAQVSVFPCTAPPPAVDSLPPLITNGELVKINGEDAILACP
ncbi:MAG TPA: hypothetical protein VIN07_06145, partial [Flavipsychrobacter sp.]